MQPQRFSLEALIPSTASKTPTVRFVVSLVSMPSNPLESNQAPAATVYVRVALNHFCCKQGYGFANFNRTVPKLKHDQGETSRDRE